MPAQTIYPAQNTLGEGPLWHTERGSIFWVDILEKKLFELNQTTRNLQTYSLPERVGTVVVESKNTVVVALQSGIARLNLDTQQLDWLVDLEKDIPTNRPNDGKCDPQGRLWQGTMDLTCQSGAGTLYCIDNELKISKKLTNLTISNGMTWSMDGQRFYFIDSPTHRIESYLFDGETGNIQFEKTAVRVKPEMGKPDGMTIDTEGMLWVAHWGGSAVRRWNPNTSECLETIELPAPHISSCTFGGAGLDQLFITSARVGLSEADLEKYPESGNLFVVKMAVKGLQPNIFSRSAAHHFGTQTDRKTPEINY